MPSSTAFTRRGFVTATAGAAGALAFSPLLAACGNGSNTAKGSTNTKTGLAAILPSYKASNAVTPDIPIVAGANGAVTDAGYLTYPASPVATVTGVPGSGGSYSSVTPLWGSIPAANNAYYQAVNKALGATINMQPANGNTYNTSVTALTAAKKLPDWIQLPTWWNSTFNVGELTATQLADLTPYLAGDKVLAYPNLAAIPTTAWTAGAWNNKLYGIPSFASGTAFAGCFFYRKDLLVDKLGLSADVKSIDDFEALLKECKAANGGIGASDDLWTYLFQPYDIPQKFTVEGGKLVHKYDTPQFIEALNWAYKVAKAGYIHPDALAGDTSDANTRFYSGKCIISSGGTGAWNLMDAQSGIAANPKYNRQAFYAFSADGKSTPRFFVGAGSSIMSYLNKSLTAAQIKECLAIANYLAAPYGSAEYTLINFGVEGVDYTMTSGGPTYTDKGKTEANQDTYQFLCSPASVVSNPGMDQLTKDYCAWQADAAKRAYKPVFDNSNITVPARLATADTAQAVEDTIKEVYHGLKPVSAFQDALSTWKSSGGTEVINWYQTNVLDKFGAGQ
jgi:putative aldouronate transport system substrate-binding protein